MECTGILIISHFHKYYTIFYIKDNIHVELVRILGKKNKYKIMGDKPPINSKFSEIFSCPIFSHIISFKGMTTAALCPTNQRKS